MRTRILLAAIPIVLCSCAPVRVVEMPDFASAQASAPAEPIVPPILIDEAQAAGFVRFVDLESTRSGMTSWRYRASQLWEKLLVYKPDAVLYVDPMRSEVMSGIYTDFPVHAIALRRIGDGPLPASAVDLSKVRVTLARDGSWRAVWPASAGD